MAHYNDIVSEDGRINQRALMAVAAAKAKAEREACRKIGWERAWHDVMRAALRTVWDVAIAARTSALARAETAALPAQERLARQCDLKAELAETALPPRHEEALSHQKRAAEIRRPSLQEAA
jgi:hypothetical protein